MCNEEMYIFKKKSKYAIFLLAFLIFLIYLFREDFYNVEEGQNGIKVSLISFEKDSNVHATSSRNIASTNGNDGTILLIFWTTFFGAKPRLKDGNPRKWPFYYVGNKCPVKCELTTEQHRISEASGIVFHARDFSLDDLPPRKFRNLSWILQSHENPVYTPVLKDPEVMSKFNYYVSYRLDSDFPAPEFIKPRLDRPLPFEEKTKLVLAVYSNCEGLRTHYMGELRNHIKIDFYGSCLRTHKFLKRTSDENDTKLYNLLRSYKFTLVFPNADCDYYITEKMYNALSSGAVPVWLGTNKIDEILKWGNLKHSVIKVKDFKTPKALADYLHFLAGNKQEYNKYLRWKYEGFQFPPEYYKSAIGQWWEGLPVYCQVCMRIAKDPKGHNGLPVEKCEAKGSERLAKLIP